MEEDFPLGDLLAMPEDDFVQYLTRAYLWGEMAGEMLNESLPPISCDDVIEEILNEFYEDDDFA